MKLTKLVPVLVIILLSGCATTGEDVHAQRWRQADIDGNGVMTMAEFEASKLRWSMRFDIVDQNEDGKITQEEYRHYNRADARRLRARLEE